MTHLDPDERVCAACGCIEHKDGGSACGGCREWSCDDCADDWTDPHRERCDACVKDDEEYDKEVRWQWTHR